MTQIRQISKKMMITLRLRKPHPKDGERDVAVAMAESLPGPRRGMAQKTRDHLDHLAPEGDHEKNMATLATLVLWSVSVRLKGFAGGPRKMANEKSLATLAMMRGEKKMISLITFPRSRNFYCPVSAGAPASWGVSGGRAKGPPGSSPGWGGCQEARRSSFTRTPICCLISAARFLVASSRR